MRAESCVWRAISLLYASITIRVRAIVSSDVADSGRVAGESELFSVGRWPIFYFGNAMKQPSVRSLLQPVVEGLGYELVGVEYHPQGRHSLLRVYIDQPEGIGIEDCERVSRQISAVLDVEDPIRGQYTLEVSSPGLDRPLFEPAHFERFAGHEVKLRLLSPLEGRRRLSGRLAGVEDGCVVVEGDGESWRIPFDMIERANLVPDVTF